jgi:predicted  nucleic acid-binding Zn-ribbon protein
MSDPMNDISLEQRVVRIEADMETIQVRLARIETKLDHLASHKDLQDLAWKLMTWITGVATMLVAASFTVARFVHA